MLYNMSLIIYFIHSSLYLLNPYTCLVPPTFHLPLVTTSLFSICESVSVLLAFIYRHV